MTNTIDFTKDSEYMKLFDLTSLQKLPTLAELFFGKGIDPATDKPYVKDISEEFIEEVLTTELGSSLEKIEDGVGVGTYEEE
jgi:hypothetical protein